MPQVQIPPVPDYFWTDFEQAYHRLYGTVICYEGRPVYVVNVENHIDGLPRGHILELGSNFRSQPPVRKTLNDPGFDRFRTLPKLGWVNLVSAGADHAPMALYLKRRPVNGVQHGLCGRNVMVIDYYGKGSGIEFTTVIGDDGFLSLQVDDYPPVDFILESLQRGQAAGVAIDYAIAADSTLGLRYLIRRDEKVGLFASNEIKLPDHFMFLRDEILETPAFNGREVSQL